MRALLVATALNVCASSLGADWGASPRRGANVGLWLRRADLAVLKSWGVDHVRLQLLSAYFERSPSPEVAPHLRPEAWASLRRFLADAEAEGLDVVIDLHAFSLFFPNAYWEPEALKAWQDPSRIERLCCFWKDLAQRLGDMAAVLGYDVLNEPHPPNTQEGFEAWNTVAQTVARTLIQVAPSHTVVIEAPSYANPDGMRHLRPVSEENIVYSFHMYAPHEFTEQGTRPQWPFGQVYPGIIPLGWDKKTPVRVDKRWLLKAVEPVVQFQREHHARIWVGEFSARRDAPDSSAYRYLKDVIDIFEANHWDWCYHAFREASIWDLELPSDPAVKGRQLATRRLQLLKNYWQKPR